jgi:hypothetical protein
MIAFIHVGQSKHVAVRTNFIKYKEKVFFKYTPFIKTSNFFAVPSSQGDQIVRISAHWQIVFFVQIVEN